MEQWYSNRVTKLSVISRFAILLASVALSGATCGDSSVFPAQPTCVVDGECETGICFDGECTAECVSDEDCAAGEFCRSELRAPENDVVDVCVGGGNNSEGEAECLIDSDCLDERAQCGADGFCFVPELTFGVLITDRTVPQSVPADGGVGADIAAVFLRDADGEVLAWADTLEVAPANDVAIQNAPAGGSRPLLDDQTCVDAPYEAVATPLGGDGGYLLVRFLESQTGNPVRQPTEGWQLVVVEWGENCPEGDGGEQDLFDVAWCEAPSFDAMDPLQHCVDAGQMVSGDAVFDVPEK